MPVLSLNGISLSHVDYERVKVQEAERYRKPELRGFWGCSQYAGRGWGAVMCCLLTSPLVRGAAASGKLLLCSSGIRVM